MGDSDPEDLGEVDEAEGGQQAEDLHCSHQGFGLLVGRGRVASQHGRPRQGPGFRPELDEEAPARRGRHHGPRGQDQGHERTSTSKTFSVYLIATFQFARQYFFLDFDLSLLLNSHHEGRSLDLGATDSQKFTCFFQHKIFN